ncbi:MAG: hypothetical protein WC765_05940 [Phycisphaerae bacterium]|jgi:hypothetical protein
MKYTLKILTIAAMVLLTTAVFVNAEPQDNDGPGGERMGGNDRPDGQRAEFVEKILDDIRAKDPNEAARLEQLREENPRQFRMELRKIAAKDMPGMRPERKGRGGEMPGMQSPPDMQDGMPGMPPERNRENMRGMETELMAWLTKNEPAEANSLAALKEKDPRAYMRKIAIDMRKYRQIMETEETNPALAEVLKKDIKLNDQRNELLEKFRTANDDKQKETVKAELRDVMSQTFDVKLQKKQIKYENLKKRLEELQKNVDKSQTELENFKNNKDALVNEELENIISPSGQFNWD